jgi:hypothetical protein
MMTIRLLPARYEKSPNLTEPHNPSSSITERHTQGTHTAAAKFAKEFFANFCRQPFASFAKGKYP